MTAARSRLPRKSLGMMVPMLLAVLVIMALSLPLSMAMLFATPLIVLQRRRMSARR